MLFSNLPRFFRILNLICAAAGLTGFCLHVASAQDARREQPGIVEVVPTSRVEPATWRYTFERPAGDGWMAAAFDDHGWRQGRGAFGSDGTPGLRANARWTSSDIWLRREVTLPASSLDPSKLQLLAFHDEDVEVYVDGLLAARESGF